MGIYRAQVVLATTDNIPANYVSNTFAFIGPDGVTDFAAINGPIKAFYDALTSTVLGNSLSRTGHLIKWYDLPGVKPNYPIAEDDFVFTAAPTGANLPSEVALVLSFQAPRTPGTPQANRRGRIYVGPISVAGLEGGRPAQARITTLADAGAGLLSAVSAVPGWQWAVWSQKLGTAAAVTEGWVDNAFDTQRRRGIEPTNRTLYSVAS